MEDSYNYKNHETFIKNIYISFLHDPWTGKLNKKIIIPSQKN